MLCLTLGTFECARRHRDERESPVLCGLFACGATSAGPAHARFVDGLRSGPAVRAALVERRVASVASSM